ncbi:MAG: hypothetical protein RL238_837 [Actinomycetota bacterium]|jgi:hypothetical protein
MKLMNITRADRCAACATDLAAGTKAYWDATTRTVTCVTCHEPATAAPLPPPVPTLQPPSLTLPPPIPKPIPAPDVAGGSALAEYEKRSARELAKQQQKIDDDAQWRQAIKEERPFLGRLVSAFTPAPQIGPESQSTKAWKVGAEGEERVAEVLRGVVGIEVLHDRLVPGKGKANIDHIVVGPGGVFVVDAKKYSGTVERRDVGGMFRVDERLYVNNRDRTGLVEAMLGQVDVVRAALATTFPDVPVHGVLCFVECTWNRPMRPKQVKGVTALWPMKLPEFVAAAGIYAPAVSSIAEHLRGQLRRAA